MTAKKIFHWVLTGFMALCIILLVVLGISSQINGGTPTVLGNQLMVVLSGSMAPTFNTGSIVGVKSVPFEEIKVEDIVTFKDIDGKTVTHRVVEIAEGRLVTKGDANDGIDATPVTSERVIGKVKMWVPYAGYFVQFAKSKTGLLVFLVVPGAYLVITQLWKLFKLLTSGESEEDTKTQV
ncbi:MAG: signal peptidase I [Clostridia bacterium]